MTTIDHAAEALACTQYSWDSEDIDRGKNHMAQAQVHATLALKGATDAQTEQLRIANRIALAIHADQYGTKFEFNADITKALGLDTP